MSFSTFVLLRVTNGSHVEGVSLHGDHMSAQLAAVADAEDRSGDGELICAVSHDAAGDDVSKFTHLVRKVDVQE